VLDHVPADADGEAYITGSFFESIDLGPFTLTGDHYDVFVPELAPPLPTCGDNAVNRQDEQCDGTDDAACPGQCQSDCTCPPPPDAIPTLSTWGVAMTTLLLLVSAKAFGWHRARAF
jgi:hypothetical protein